MCNKMDKHVEEYIKKQESPQKEILLKIREIFIKTLPNCKERIAWGVVVFGKDKFYIAVMKNRLHVGFAIDGLAKEEIRFF